MMPRSRQVLLASGVTITLAAGYAISQWWPVLICCLPNGTDCWPIEQAQECPGGRLVQDCPCPATLPDGSTDCGC